MNSANVLILDEAAKGLGQEVEGIPGSQPQWEQCVGRAPLSSCPQAKDTPGLVGRRPLSCLPESSTLTATLHTHPGPGLRSSSFMLASCLQLTLPEPSATG